MSFRQLFTTSGLCLVLFLWSLPLAAQSNWQPVTITYTDGQQASGEIDDRRWSFHFSDFRFRTNATDHSPTRVDLAGVSHIRLAERSYLVKDMTINTSPRDTRFLLRAEERTEITLRIALQVLVEGPLALYEYADRQSNSHFFITENDGALEYLDFARYRLDSEDGLTSYTYHNGHRRRLQAAMASCDNIGHDIRRMDYRRKDLLNVFERFYNCGRQRSGYWHTPEKNVWLFGLDAGITQSDLLYGDLPIGAANVPGLRSVDPTFGGHIKYRFSGMQGGVTLKLAALYQAYNIAHAVADTENTNDDVVSTLEYIGSERALHFQFGPQIVLVRSRYPLFLETAVEYHRLLDYLEFRFNRRITVAGEEIIGREYNFSDTGAFGLTAGVGVVAGKFTLSLRGGVTRRKYPEYVLNLYRLGVLGSYDF